MISLKEVRAEPLQKSVFIQSEGDQWFERNQAALAEPSVLRDSLVTRIARHLPEAAGTAWQVLEIGCGQGGNLDALSRVRSIKGRGIDPSARAVAAGTSDFPHLELCVGTADALPYAEASQDMVWFGFCLYLVDRGLLQRVVAEADRVLRDGGMLVMVDFDPLTPCKRPYHHKNGLYSYKMDYSHLFLANPAYSLLEKYATSHTKDGWAADPQERIALNVCCKNMNLAYQLV